MLNQYVNLTYPQRLAQALQNTGPDNTVQTANVQMPQTQMGAGPDIMSMMRLKGMMGQRTANPMDAAQIQMANDREAEDMSWGR